MLPAALAVALASLAGCGPDTGSGATSEASGAQSAGTAAASAAMSGAPTPSSKPASLAAAAPEAQACPKLVQPKCPAAPGPAAAPLPHALAAPMSKASDRLWARHRGEHHARLHARRERRDLDQRRESQVDRYADLRDTEMRSGYRMREQSSESDRLVVRREGYGAGRPCPRTCPGAGHRDWDFAGIDARGYLVWPGKVEY